MKIEWSGPALRALENLHSYISQDSVTYADAFVQRLLNGVRRLEQFPLSGRAVPEAPDEKLRELIIAPYRLIYRVQQKSVQIVTVVHSGRDLDQSKLKGWEL